MFPYSTLSLVRFWIHAPASVYASIGTAPCIWQSLVRRCLCLRSTVSPFFWEMTPGFAVFSAWFDSGYMYCQSTEAWIFHVFLRGFTRTLRSFLVLLFLSSFLAVACAKLVLLVILHLALFLFLFSGPDARHHCRYGPAGQLCSGMCKAWFAGMYTSCAVSLLPFTGPDALQYGRYGPEGQFVSRRSSTSLS